MAEKPGRAIAPSSRLVHTNADGVEDMRIGTGRHSRLPDAERVHRSSGERVRHHSLDRLSEGPDPGLRKVGGERAEFKTGPIPGIRPKSSPVMLDDGIFRIDHAGLGRGTPGLA